MARRKTPSPEQWVADYRHMTPDERVQAWGLLLAQKDLPPHHVFRGIEELLLIMESTHSKERVALLRQAEASLRTAVSALESATEKAVAARGKLRRKTADSTHKDAEIARLKAAGKKDDQIACATGLSLDAVRQRRKRAGGRA